MSALKNHKHEEFARQIARGIPAPQAYVSLGYKLKPGQDGNAYALKSSAKVARRIEEIQELAVKRIAKRLALSNERIVQEYARIGLSDMTDIVTVKDGKIYVTDTDSLPEDVTACISKLKQTKEGIEVQFHDKPAALAKLGLHQGLFKENINLNVSLSLADLINQSYLPDEPMKQIPAPVETEK